MTHTVNLTGALSMVLAQARRTAGYLARQEIERIQAEAAKDPLRLEPYGFKVYSQGDEDGILEEIFRRLGIECGTFCEIGVENGLECNSLWLLHKGWRGVWIEGNVNQQSAIEQKFASLMKAEKLKLCIGMVTAENINALLSIKELKLEQIDFLSIDIDGNDIYIFEALKSRPKVICIEYNAKFPPTASVQQSYQPNFSWQGTDYMGSNITALHKAASRMGYQLVGTCITGANAFFVRQDLVKDGVWPISTPAYLSNPARYWLIFDHYGHIGHPADFGPYQYCEE